MVIRRDGQPPDSASEGSEPNCELYRLYQQYLQDALTFLLATLDNPVTASIHRKNYTPEPYDDFCLRLAVMNPHAREAYERKLRRGFEASRREDEAEVTFAAEGVPRSDDPHQEEQAAKLLRWLREPGSDGPGNRR